MLNKIKENKKRKGAAWRWEVAAWCNEMGAMPKKTPRQNTVHATCVRILLLNDR